MANDFPFEEITVSSFDEFEKTYLNIRRNRRIYHTFFRGQSEAVWGLIPSIFRNFESDNVPTEKIKDAFRKEYLDVSYFIIQADRMGFDLPGDLWEFLNPSNIDLSNDDIFDKWYHEPGGGRIELITLAQHYGIQTRFLDFTYNPYTALFFAAEDVVRKLIKEKEEFEESNNFFSLWLLDRLNLNNMPDSNIPNVEYFEVPTARNKYLNAQKGLFISPLLPSLEIENNTIDIKLFDISEAIIKNNFDRVSDGEEGLAGRWPTIYKFNFPFSKAPQILQDLNYKHNVNILTQRPNLDNIALYREYELKINNLAYQYRT